MTTIKEIAHLAGVSRGTVDRVLNNRGAVNQKTAQKILEIAKALNYSPNLAGKTLAVRKKQLKFGYLLFRADGNPFFQDVVEGIESRAEELREYGVTVEIRFCPIDNPMAQVEAIDALMSEGVDGLAITAINHPLVREHLRALTGAGLPVVTVNSDIPDCGRLCYVGSDYYKSGETAAGVMNLICGGKANVGVVIGSPWVHCHSERVAGFVNRIGAVYPALNLVDLAINNDDDVESYAVTMRLLEEHEEINALYLAAAGVLGACRAVKQLGREMPIVSYDATEPICELVRQGTITATISQQPFTQGTKPLDILMDYLGMDMKPEREFFYTKIEIRIIENLT